ncbi:DUF7263 family protein [Halobellus sp. EA9]|uniref:DUF7263 family protein n=1 Tax=Halobellus sp. EA9 TaxID=3421647 RepID=UPI003EBE69B2
MTDRAQANLIGFAVAVIVVVTVTVGGAGLATDALADAEREPAAVHAAERLADSLVAGDSAHTRGPNVLDAAATANLTLADVDAAAPPVRGRPVRISLGGDVLLARGAFGDRHSAGDEPVRIVRRVRVEHDAARTERLDLRTERSVTLDDHGGNAAVTIDPVPGQSVTTVRAGGRVVLHDRSGLDGEYAVRLPSTRPLAVRFEVRGSGLGRAGTATVAWAAPTGRDERLVVVVGV